MQRLCAILPARSDDNDKDKDGEPAKRPSQIPPVHRLSVEQACMNCRRSRIKCDGQRPRCGSCTTKDRSCGYRPAVPPAMDEATSARFEALENLVSTIQTGSDEAATRIFERLRLSNDLSWANKSTLGAARQKSSNSPSVASPEVVAELRFRQQNQGQSTNHHNGPIVPEASGLRNVTLPDASITLQAESSFFGCSGKLFHVFSREQIGEQYNIVYQRRNESLGILGPAICCVMAVAAVGAQYEYEKYDSEIESTFYHIARNYFELLVEHKHLDAIKVCILFAMYNIFAKATVSLAYIEIGLGLSRLYGLESGHICQSTASQARRDCRRTWRTLVFLSSWLSSTLGYISGNDMDIYKTPLRPELKSDGSPDIGEMVETELTNIAVLKTKILRMHLMFKELELSSLQTILDDLQAWYDKLPPQLRFDYTHRDKHTTDIQWSIYHLHLLYLGAHILLYRRMITQLARSITFSYSSRNLPAPTEELFLRHSQQAILAAKGSARILNLLLQDSGVFKRCWLVIFQANNSCLILLHSTVQKIIHGLPILTWQDSMQKAELSLSVLEFCSTQDASAKCFYTQLKPIYDWIVAQQRRDQVGNLVPECTAEPCRSPQPDRALCQEEATPSPSYLITTPENTDQYVIDLSSTLLKLLCQPFGDPSNRKPDDTELTERWRDDPGRSSHSQLMDQLDWNFESRLQCQWDIDKIGIGQSVLLPSVVNVDSPSARTQSVGGAGNQSTQLGSSNQHMHRFLGSMTPSGWAATDVLSVHHQDADLNEQMHPHLSACEDELRMDETEP